LIFSYLLVRTQRNHVSQDGARVCPSDFFFSSCLLFHNMGLICSDKTSIPGSSMSAIVQTSRPAPLNRRRRVRQKVHAPAYASFSGASKSEMLDLYEVLDISDAGMAVQCPSPMKIDQQVELCLDLAEASGEISATARVVWSDSAGRVGLSLPALTASALQRLREWLFLNAMAGAANAAASGPLPSTTPEPSVLRPNYTDTLNAASAVQREAESLASDLEAVLSLIASRSQSLLRASGAAIALAGKDAGAMICRASAGQSAPPVGAILQVGSGFSGECVLTGKMLRCDDTETDERVDRQSCRALGIRSMLAAPLRLGERVIGLLEVFSAQPSSFDENDSAVLQRFAETILAAINRAARAYDPPLPPPAPPKPFSPLPGSVLFAYEPEEKTEKEDASGDQDKVGGIRLPRLHLFLLIAAAATIALALGFVLAPWMQPWIQERLRGRGRNGEHTVLASSQAPADATKSVPSSSVDSASLGQLRELAGRSDPVAENALGLLYAEGDEKQAIKPDQSEAARWFAKAAGHGSVSAQYKLGLLYWGGHGVPKDANKAYFWAVLARAGGQEGSQDLAKVLANGMTRAQAAAIEQQAELWYQQHESRTKP
jgi:putative methionine-R-sulfoxide reductase with GAF domain